MWAKVIIVRGATPPRSGTYETKPIRGGAAGDGASGTQGVDGVQTNPICSGAM
jgi:hypothetical protein